MFGSRSQLIGALAVTTVAVAAAAAFVQDSSVWRLRRRRRFKGTDDDDEIHVAFLGNSILYFNDCPRLVENMLKERYKTEVQNSCLRGGVNLTQLWAKGNGMRNKFAVPNSLQWNRRHDIGALNPQKLLEKHSWDFVVINDHTQAPTRESSKQESITTLEDHLIPRLKAGHMIPVLLQTFAYKVPKIRGTQDLGDIQQYTQLLAEGYNTYCHVIQQNLGECRIAPMGEAVLWLHQNHRELWGKLYSWDDFHPSPHGTWLEASILFCTMTRQEPPHYNPLWWDSSRYMQPPDQKPLPLPTNEEAEVLRQLACSICKIQMAPDTSLTLNSDL